VVGDLHPLPPDLPSVGDGIRSGGAPAEAAGHQAGPGGLHGPHAGGSTLDGAPCFGVCRISNGCMGLALQHAWAAGNLHGLQATWMLPDTCSMPLFQVKLNRGLDFVPLDDVLVDLKLAPDVLEVPVPRYFVEDRAKVGAGVLQRRV